MSINGNRWANALAENVFKIFKSEILCHSLFKAITETKIAIFEFIEIWNNKKFKHAYLKHMTL